MVYETDYNKVLESNIRLMDKQKELISDIKLLVRYIQGNKNLEYEAQNIIKHYGVTKNKESEDQE